MYPGGVIVSIPSQAGILLAEPLFFSTQPAVFGVNLPAQNSFCASQHTYGNRFWAKNPLSSAVKSLVRFFKVFPHISQKTARQAAFVTLFGHPALLTGPG